MTTTSSSPLTIGVIILTTGDRPHELNALLASVTAQHGPAADVAVIGQGTALPRLPPGVTAVELPENLGIPAGRNTAVAHLREHTDPDIVVILDDDGLLPDPTTLNRVRDAFTTHQTLGIISFRIADPTGHTQRRHIPRPGTTSPLRSGPVTTYLGGGHAIRMTTIDQAGPFPAPFFYAHEETDFAWRALDAGWEIHYRADIVLQHPATDPARHSAYYYNTGRNRVWLAKRRLPAVLVPLYLTAWAAYTLTQRPPAWGLKAWWAGFLDGIRQPCPPRRPIRWRTVWDHDPPRTPTVI